MMGIPCGYPTFVYGDNKAVLANTTVNASTFKKNMNILYYHFVVRAVHGIDVNYRVITLIVKIW